MDFYRVLRGVTVQNASYKQSVDPKFYNLCMDEKVVLGAFVSFRSAY
jgi:hypothetical protein